MAETILRAKRPGKRKAPAFGVFDLETDGLGGEFVLGGVYDTTQGYRTFDDLVELVDYLLHSKTREWYAHNGARYDFKYFLKQEVREYFQKKGINLRFMTTKIDIIGFTAEIPHSGKTVKVKFKDFYRFVPFPLEKITKLFGIEHQKLSGSIDFEGGERFDPCNELHLKYLKNDCLGLYESIISFDQYLWDHFKVSPGWTAPGTAMDAFRKTLPDGYAWPVLTKRKRDFLRKCYYGGMVQVRYAELPELAFGAKKEDMKLGYYDVNSMYPAQMLKGVPVGTPAYTKKYHPGKPGFYRVRASVPESAFPMVPYRDKTGTKWPVGTFETYLTNIEIDFAEKQGCTFGILEGYIFPNEEKIFDKFIHICMDIRKNHKGSPLEIVAKLMQNSLYGKFGTSEEMETLYFVGGDYPPGAMPYVDPSTGELIEGCFTLTETLETPYLQPHWAAWITAQSRLVLSDVIVNLGKRFVYCDTDSVLFISNNLESLPFAPDPKEYGKFKHEGTADEFYCAGPKTYAIRFADRWSVKSKGIPTRKITHEDVKKACQGQTVKIPFTSLASLSVLVRNATNGPQATHINRQCTIPDKVLGFRFNPTEKTFEPIKLTLDTG